MSARIDWRPRSLPVLSARGLSKSFARGLVASPGRTSALEGVDVDLCGGELIGLAGGHGAGKTTLLQCLCGLLRRDSGRIELSGDPLPTGNSSAAIAYVPALPVFYPFLTVRDVIQFGAARRGLHARPAAVTEMAMRVLDLQRLADCRIMALAPDVLHRVAVGEAIAGNPEVILVDTPPAQAARPIAPAVLSALEGWSNSGAAVMIATREASAVASVATRILLLDHGRMSRTFALESFGEPIIGPSSPPSHRFVAERVH